jgi:hypothetical protein
MDKAISNFEFRISDLGRFVVCFLVVAVLMVAAQVAGADDYAERAATVEKLTSAEKAELLRKKQRFDELPPQEKERLRELHAKISAAPDAAELEKLLGRYCDWLKNLSSLERAEVQSLPPSERIARIKEIVVRQEGNRFTEYVQAQLPKEDRDAIYKWLDEFVQQHEEEIIDRLPHEVRRRIRDIDDSRARRRALVQQLPWRRWDPKMPYPSGAETERMLTSLSAETRKRLESVEEEKRVERARELVGAAIFSIALPPPSEEDLRKLYLSLPTDERARLDAMDSEATQKELVVKYRLKHFRSRGGQWGWHGGPPGGSPGGPPRDGPRGDGRERGPGPPPPGPPPPGLASPK